MKNELQKKIEKLLPKVEQPGRYIGGEWNSTTKVFSETPLQMAFCFPDVYEVAMSHLGLEILYGLINEKTPYIMERVFCPWPDMMNLMEEAEIPLYSLESYTPLKDFPIIGFTLQYELSYTNILQMLKIGQVPILAKDRKDDESPLVIGGGPCAVNPEPIAAFFDLFLIGDGEESLPKLLELAEGYLNKETGYLKNKRDFLIDAANIEGIYVPAFFEERINASGSYDGTFLMEELQGLVPNKPRRAIVKDLDKAYFPTKPVVPLVDAIHDRIMLEVLRGCSHTCRFCQAGIIYRPVRERSLKTLLEQGESLVKNTGHDDISLTSLSTADYTQVAPLIEGLMNKYEEHKISISLPSLRVDKFSVDLAKMIQKVRKTGFTFAPEAGTQRMRDKINKGVTEEGLMEALEGAFMAGWKRVKLYYMLGLPGEEDEDISGIMELSKKALTMGRRITGLSNISLNVSVSSFVPKPFTPFQWVGQNSKEELQRKQGILRSGLTGKGKGIKLSYHASTQSVLEAMLARGDRKLSALILDIHQNGCFFDSWDEWFKENTWQESLDRLGMSKEEYAEKTFKRDDHLFWDHLDIGVSKEYLFKEYQKSLEGDITKDCRLGCTGCSLCDQESGVKIDLQGAYSG